MWEAFCEFCWCIRVQIWFQATQETTAHISCWRILPLSQLTSRAVLVGGSKLQPVTLQQCLRRSQYYDDDLLRHGNTASSQEPATFHLYSATLCEDAGHVGYPHIPSHTLSNDMSFSGGSTTAAEDPKYLSLGVMSVLTARDPASFLSPLQRRVLVWTPLTIFPRWASLALQSVH